MKSTAFCVVMLLLACGFASAQVEKLDTLGFEFVYGFPTDIDNLYVGYEVNSVPEPASLIALSVGIVGLIGLRRRRRRR
ncbi:MAG: PEP-CTERM sorting domain-containing protein [Armatimonadetes bacterium]|nr:PEP-CTERM sorting domain-containing protein [Armatimonadota bacterium]